MGTDKTFEKAYIKIKGTIDEGSPAKQKIFAQAKLEELIKAESEKQKIDGRIWFASKSLTAIKNINAYLTDEIKADLEGFIAWSKAREIKTDFCYWINRGIENVAMYARGSLTDLIDKWTLTNLAT